MDLAAQLRRLTTANLAIIGAWISVFAACVFAYIPGLDGPFLFDDFGSLSGLGDRGGITDWESFQAFVFGGHAGPTGRPLALLSFLIDAQNWPAEPWPFKRTNLVIHLLTGAFLGGLVYKILTVLRCDRSARRWVALISTAGWLLHPFLVSTTLYAVQRMAQLSTLFIFVGLTAYLHYRASIAHAALKSYVGMSVSVGVFTFLAMLCKENGILLPLLVGVVEITIVASQRARMAPLSRYWSAIFIITPLLVISWYLGDRIMRDDFFDIRPPRDFSVYERLLTQPRILVDYLRHWFAPSLYTSGVFQDHFAKSTGLLVPVTTLLSLLLHLGLISWSFVKRRKWPLFALAVLFFYTSHLLESTVINLELYFEHRNYLAAALLFLPVVAFLQRRVSRQWCIAAAVGTLLLLAGFTRYSATIWQDYSSMVAVAARVAPTSARAQTQYATDLYNAQRYDESLQVIDRAIENNPAHNSLLITRGTLLCMTGALDQPTFDALAKQLSANVYDVRSIRLYTALVTPVTEQRCPAVSIASLRAMFTNMLAIPKNGNPRSLRYSQIKYFIGLLHVHSAEPKLALKAFEQSLRARSGATHAMAMAALLASNNYYDEALYLSGLALARLERKASSVIDVKVVNIDDVRTFRSEIRQLMADCVAKDGSSNVDTSGPGLAPGETSPSNPDRCE